MLAGSAKGLKTCCVAGESEFGFQEGVKEDVLAGKYQLVLFTPEMLVEKKAWRKMLLGDVYSTRLRAFVVDEAHTVKKWSVCYNMHKLYVYYTIM